jgi:hypothetical protein
MVESFAPSGFTFDLISIDYTINSTWAFDGDPLAMKTALHKGEYSDLNVYYQTQVGNRVGYCHFPVPNIVKGSETFLRDGCNIRADTMPGGSLKGYELGKTTIHEVGHWFGLYHTFQGGCNDAFGDGVDDTPPTTGQTFSCRKGLDTCPGGGEDPIHNYMGYEQEYANLSSRNRATKSSANIQVLAHACPSLPQVRCKSKLKLSVRLPQWHTRMIPSTTSSIGSSEFPQFGVLTILTAGLLWRQSTKSFDLKES